MALRRPAAAKGGWRRTGDRKAGEKERERAGKGQDEAGEEAVRQETDGDGERTAGKNSKIVKAAEGSPTR